MTSYTPDENELLGALQETLHRTHALWDDLYHLESLIHETEDKFREIELEELFENDDMIT